MVRKPSLRDLTARKPAGEVEPEITAPARERAGDKAGAQPDGRKGILVRVNPEGWRLLRDLAADMTLSSGRQVTMQSLITDAINDLLHQHGRPPVA